MVAAPDEIKGMNAYAVISYPAAAIPDSYINMVLSKWLRSLRFGNDYFRLVDSKSYYEVYDKYIKSILKRPDTVAKFAVLSDDHDVVLGFSVSAPGVLHYVHVHEANRKCGIGTALIPSQFESFTHITKMAMPIWSAKFKTVKFNPFL